MAEKYNMEKVLSSLFNSEPFIRLAFIKAAVLPSFHVDIINTLIIYKQRFCNRLKTDCHGIPSPFLLELYQNSKKNAADKDFEKIGVSPL